MPMYILIEKATGEETSNFFSSYDAFKEFLAVNPTFEEGVGALNIVSGVRSGFKTDNEFKSLLKHVGTKNKALGGKIDVN